MDLKKIEKLMQLMNKHKVGDLEYEEESGKIKLSQNTGGVVMAAPALAPAQVVAPTTAAAPSAAPANEESAAASGKGIRSPFVGTFYRSPSPDAAPFVKVGDTVRKGDVVCIIEAMKIMNEIEADQDGVVKDVLVENNSPIEFDQTLFLLD